MLTQQEKQEINEKLKLVPYKRAASIEALKIVQRHKAWVSDNDINDLSEYLEVSKEDLENVATFYNLIFRKPVGRHLIFLCDSVSCYILGYQKIYGILQKKLKIEFGETTSDKRFTLIPIPCLGACDHAPVMIINDDLFKNLSIEKIDDILSKYK